MSNIRDFVTEEGVLVIPNREFDDTGSVLTIPNNVKTLYGQDGCWPEDVNAAVKRIVFEPGGKVDIEDGAFDYYYPFIQEIDFADSVNRIGEYAFPKKKLTEIILPEGLAALGGSAFTGCKDVVKIIIPDSVTSVGNGCFNGCDKLQSLECNQENFDRFLDSFNAKNKQKMVLGYLRGDYKCTSSLGEKTIAYLQKNQKKLIDAIVEEDNDYSMGALLSLPAKYDKEYLKITEKKAGSKVLGVLLDYLNMKDDSSKAEKLLLEDEQSKPKTIEEWKKIFQLTNLGENEICVGKYKGYETSVTIPDSIGKRKVTKIEKTFFENTSITNVYLPEGLLEIGQESFRGCSALQQIILPKSLQIIGSTAFKECCSLAEIIIPEKLKAIRASAFEKCTCLTEIIIPDSVKEIGTFTDVWDFGSAFSGCTNLKSVKLSDKIKCIPSSTFCGCSSLTKIELPQKLKEIGAFAFTGCSSLESLYIPDTVKKVSVDHVFRGCEKLIITAKKGSFAEQYAIKSNIPVETIEE